MQTISHSPIFLSDLLLPAFESLEKNVIDIHVHDIQLERYSFFESQLPPTAAWLS